MVKLPKILVYWLFSYGACGPHPGSNALFLTGGEMTPSGYPVGPLLEQRKTRGSAGFGARVLQTEFFLAFDLNHLRVVDRDLDGTETQIAQGALDLTQNGCFVLAVNATQRCAHGRAPEMRVAPAVGHCLWREGNLRQGKLFLKILFKNFNITKCHYQEWRGLRR